MKGRRRDFGSNDISYSLKMAKATSPSPVKKGSPNLIKHHLIRCRHNLMAARLLGARLDIPRPLDLKESYLIHKISKNVYL